MAAAAVAVDMSALAAPAVAAQTAAANGGKSNDTLFGPNIGVLGAGPKWTERTDKSEDVLTPEVVKGWIAKSKEVSNSVLPGYQSRGLSFRTSHLGLVCTVTTWTLSLLLNAFALYSARKQRGDESDVLQGGS